MLAAVLVLAAPLAVDLNLSLTNAKVEEGSAPSFVARIKNRSKYSLQLLDLQDGSAWHWSNPHVGWSFIREGSKETHPTDVPKARTPRCGNMNPVEPQMFRTLAPGKSEIIHGMAWAYSEPLSPGKYRAVFYYEVTETPARVDEGLGGVPKELLSKYESLTPLKLRSNEVRFEVVKNSA